MVIVNAVKKILLVLGISTHIVIDGNPSSKVWRKDNDSNNYSRSGITVNYWLATRLHDMGEKMRIVKPDAISVMRDGYYTLIESEDTIEITDILWRPNSWPDFVEYFNNRPEGMTAQELWEFGATSMLNALISLTGEGR